MKIAASRRKWTGTERVVDLLPKQIASGEWLRTKADVIQLADALREDLGYFVADSDVVAGRFDRDPLFRIFRLDQSLTDRKREERERSEARFARYMSVDPKSLSDLDLLEGMNLTAYVEVRRHAELRTEYNRRFTPKSRPQDLRLLRMEAAETLRCDPPAIRTFALCREWGQVLRLINGYVETDWVVTIRRVLQETKDLDKADTSATEKILDQVLAFLDSDPEIFGGS